MSICTKPAIGNWLKAHPKTREWLWFVGLWCLGLAAVSAMAYPIKLLVRAAS